MGKPDFDDDESQQQIWSGTGLTYLTQVFGVESENYSDDCLCMHFVRNCLVGWADNIASHATERRKSFRGFVF